MRRDYRDAPIRTPFGNLCRHTPTRKGSRRKREAYERDIPSLETGLLKGLLVPSHAFFRFLDYTNERVFTLND